MNNKEFGLMVILSVFFLGSSSVLAQVGANSKYEAGLHYQVIENASLMAGDTVKVAEAFSYMCTHCATFEPYISAWHKRQAANVVFNRLPVVFGRGSWEVYARAYVTADLMGVADEAHGPLMDKLWKQHEVLKSMEELSEFYAEFGVNPETFIATSKSFAVDAKLRKDQRDVQEAGVRGTPSLIVAGKYLVANSDAVGSYEVLLDVVDYLVAMELAAHAAEVVQEEVAEQETIQIQTKTDDQG